MCHDFKEYEETLGSCSIDSEDKLKELLDIEKMSQEFEEYLRQTLGEEEEERKRFENCAWKYYASCCKH